jgi:MFS family permease
VLLTVAILVWCSMTALSGMAKTFASLFILRMGVGIGEAALQPAAYSLIADLFAVRRMPRAFSVMTMVGTLGGVGGMVGGGAAYEALRTAAAHHTLPLAPEDAWRWVTTAFGLAGLVVAVLAGVLIQEPRRSQKGAAAPSGEAGNLLAYLPRSGVFIIPYTAALCVYCLYAAGVGGWMTPFFTRAYGWSIGRVGQGMGLLSLLTGLVGPVIAVVVSQLVRAWRGHDAPVLVIAIVLAIGLPFVALGPLAPSGLMALGALGVVMVFSGAASVISPIVFTSTAPAQIRARMIALSNLMFGLFGTSLGGVAYALFTERVLGGPNRLGLTLSILSTALLVLCIALLLVSSPRYRRAVATARAAEGAG